MLCPLCDRPGRKYGFTRQGRQRYFCKECSHSFGELAPPRDFGAQFLTMKKAALAVRLLMEGASIRSVCRSARIGQSTLLQLVLRIGEGCAKLMEERIEGVRCRSVQCDELWSFVYCKQKTLKKLPYAEDELGDCYTWTGIEPVTKLLLCYVVGKRDHHHGREFLRKLRRATSKARFQIDTDGLALYRVLIPVEFGSHQDHAAVVKIFSTPAEGEARYSPPQIIDLHIEAVSGSPDVEAASTSFVERMNLSIRMMLRRFTRLTNGHSKSWRHHKAAIGLLFAFYNFARPHMTLTKRNEGRKTTPAMEALLTDHVWTIPELIRAVIPEGEEAKAS
jgi:transposase-like protein/IS1 family transposase